MSDTIPEGAKARTRRGRINDFLRSPWYVLVIACLTVLSSVFGLELIVYSVFIAIGVYLCMFGDDLLPLMPVVI